MQEQITIVEIDLPVLWGTLYDSMMLASKMQQIDKLQHASKSLKKPTIQEVIHIQSSTYFTKYFGTPSHRGKVRDPTSEVKGSHT